MDKVAAAVAELIQKGAPIADRAVGLWFGYHVIDALVGMGECAIIMYGLYVITRRITQTILTAIKES